MEVPTTRRRRIRPEYVIASLLLLIPLGTAIYCFLPRYATFTAPGEILSVQELGVNGSVRFCYVREGVVRNLYERWDVRQTFPEAVFAPADASALEELEWMEEIGGELRDETILHALAVVEEAEEEPWVEEEKTSRLEDLIERAGEYYGDSLGLMLAIGLFEESRNEDFSGGGRYVISGTGTMEADHTVGSVGAIRDKLLTAERFGADYFFVPGDLDRFYYEGPSNEEEALLSAEELGLRLEVVPVDTLEEAIDFLKRLNG